jgi:TonB family protein
MPSDPGAIIAMAAKVNGLNGPNLQPWHIKASYQTFDLKGKLRDSGTYEEFWSSDRKYRRSYTSANFTQTDVANGSGLFRSGNQSWPNDAEANVRTELTQPIPELDFQSLKLEKQKKSFGSAELICITLASEHMYADTNVYCFAPDQPALRFDASLGRAYETSYNGIVLFQGRYVAKDIRIASDGNSFLTLNVETIEMLPQVNDSDFVPPSDAIEIPRDKIALSPATVQGYRTFTVSPNYPSFARSNHVQGTVIVQTSIGKDGTIIAARAISGPPVLRQAAVDSVLRWKFRPFLVLGEPVEVETQFEVAFTLG